jgi:hypothetical protein
MSIVNLEMKDIIFVDLPVQAIMIGIVEEPKPEPEPRPEPKVKYELTCEDIWLRVMITPLVIAMIPMGIMGILGTVAVAIPCALAYSPVYIYNKCKNKN